MVYRTEEQQLLSDIVELCRKYDVLVFHSTDARRDIGAGFPDLCMVGRKGILFAELKSQSGQMGKNQLAWKYRLMVTSHYALWKPDDLKSGHIESVLENL